MQKLKSVYQRVAIVYNADKERARAEGLRLKKWFTSRGVVTLLTPEVTREVSRYEMVVVLGGDGTVLRVARGVVDWNIPILGVNVGHLGFLAATEVGAMYRTLSKVLSGKGRIERRVMLETSAVVKGKKVGPYVALNDCVIRTGPTGHVLNLLASIKEKSLASYQGDGLIASTPTGSTAYNLAASGPIVYPELDALILAPICPHSLSQRPLVIPNYETVSIEIRHPSAAALLCIDGDVRHTLRSGDSVQVYRGSKYVQLVMDPAQNFYQVLQSKLKWGA